MNTTHSEALSVASVHQFVIACIEGECLHDSGACPQELPVQLPHCKRRESETMWLISFLT